MDKTTFGNTPAAMFLVARLNELGNTVLTRKLSRTMQQYREVLRDAKDAHECRAITTQTLSWMISRLNEKLDTTNASMLTAGLDRIAVNLMTNVLRGEIKSVINKSRKIRHIERQQREEGLKAKYDWVEVFNKDGVVVGHEKTSYEPIIMKLDNLKDPKTAYALQKKSAAKLKAAGKPNTLY